MCGIVGVYNFSEKESTTLKVEKSLSLMKHRGPDVQKIWANDKVVFGHARLSIIDLNERSNQPMVSTDGRYSLVFNGEIFNYGELKNDLFKEGYQFTTSSDTEVLFYGLQKFGVDYIQYLNGFFAFAFYDEEKDELLIARDRLGIKPLLYHFNGESVSFASELKPLLCNVPDKEICLDALQDLFKLTYIPAPKTILKDVFKLEPGTYLLKNKEGLNLKKYYEPKKQVDSNLGFEEACSKIRFELENSVANRMISDVPLGTFLSGGFDSSIITGLASDYSNDLNTFSVGFEESTFFDESEIAQKTAKYFGTYHNRISIPKELLKSEIDNILSSYDEPFGDSSSIAVYFLAKETKKQVTVALSGDGADELFAGYNKHQAFLKSVNSKNSLLKMAKPFSKIVKSNNTSKAGNISRKLEKFNKLLKLPVGERYDFLASFNRPEIVNYLLLNGNSKRMLTNIVSINDFLIQDQMLVLPSDMLKKVDLMSMRHSLEVRTPFLDHHVVDAANSLPEDFKINGKQQKKVLKEAFRDLLPKHLYSVPKKGFEVPLTYWLSDVLIEKLNSSLFSESFIKTQGLFNFEFIKKIKSESFIQRSENASLIWTLLVFQDWYNRNMVNA